MGAKTGIQWIDATWSPLRVRVRNAAAAIARVKGYASLIQIGEKMAGRVGQHCEHVSDGCKLCYSGTWQGRCLKSGGTGLPFDRRSRDLIEPFVDEKTLVLPLRWRTPKKIFVENQSDLFGEWYSDEQIGRVFAVMALCPEHTFQVLTKRPERMLAYLGDVAYRQEMIGIEAELLSGLDRHFDGPGSTMGYGITWRLPLPNVWLGVSVENQATADARIPLLLQTPAAKRFVSYEPALGPVDFRHLAVDLSGVTHELIERRTRRGEVVTRESFENYPKSLSLCGLTGSNHACDLPGLDWIIIGGESGPGARPLSLRWAYSLLKQCRSANVACFIKQLGRRPGTPSCADFDCTHPDCGVNWLRLQDPKGGDMSEWPEGLRVREFPEVQC